MTAIVLNDEKCFWTCEKLKPKHKYSPYYFQCLFNNPISISISHKFIQRAQASSLKTQSESRLESEVLIVHVMAEVVYLQVRLETRKCVALS